MQHETDLRSWISASFQNIASRTAIRFLMSHLKKSVQGPLIIICLLLRGLLRAQKCRQEAFFPH